LKKPRQPRKGVDFFRSQVQRGAGQTGEKRAGLVGKSVTRKEDAPPWKHRETRRQLSVDKKRKTQNKGAHDVQKQNARAQPAYTRKQVGFSDEGKRKYGVARGGKESSRRDKINATRRASKGKKPPPRKKKRTALVRLQTEKKRKKCSRSSTGTMLDRKEEIRRSSSSRRRHDTLRNPTTPSLPKKIARIVRTEKRPTSCSEGADGA